MQIIVSPFIQDLLQTLAHEIVWLLSKGQNESQEHFFTHPQTLKSWETIKNNISDSATCAALTKIAGGGEGDCCILCERNWRKLPYRVCEAVLCSCLKDVQNSCMQKATWPSFDYSGCGYPLSVKEAINCRSAGERFTPLTHAHPLYNVSMSFTCLIVSSFTVIGNMLWFLHKPSIPFYVHLAQDSRKLQCLHQNCLGSLGLMYHTHQDHLQSTGHPCPPSLKRYGTTASGKLTPWPG